MKFSRVIMLALLPAAFVLTSVPSQAQGSVAPDGQLGIHAGTAGVGLQYAVSPSIHAGAGFGVLLGDVNTAVEFGPYVRFLFEGDVNPFIEGRLQISSREVDNPFGGGSETNTTTAIAALAGLEFFPTPNVGVFGAIGVLEINLDAETTVLGLSPSGRAGVEWFFD